MDAFGLEQRPRNYGSSIVGQPGVPDSVDERGFAVDEENRYFTIYWGQYDYVIEFDRIDTPENALVWLHHMGEKTWKFTSSERMMALLAECANRFDWNLNKPV